MAGKENYPFPNLSDVFVPIEIFSVSALTDQMVFTKEHHPSKISNPN